ncbi:MAG: hypothetical protein E7381_03540 [Clostridiales bacterium]|nr:hypothetical protein [Clostridiales bacterium]
MTERKVHLALRENLFPCRLQRQRLCASMAIAVVRRNKAFQQATVGCAKPTRKRSLSRHYEEQSDEVISWAKGVTLFPVTLE